MGLLTVEHGRAAYCADFALYGVSIAALAAYLCLALPPGQGVAVVAFTTLGAASWTLVEYALHRFVLHGLAPFKHWHAEHHRRPTALIFAPTMLTASLIVVLVFLPALALGGLWRASAFTLGILCGYLLYAITHHATHHWQAENGWLKRRKRWHALHHHGRGRPTGFGVTSTFWDHVFLSVPLPPSKRRP